MPHSQTDELNGLLLFGSESEDSTHSSSPPRSVRSAIGSPRKASGETASQEGNLPAPRLTTVTEIGWKELDWLSEFEPESAPAIPVSPPVTPLNTEPASSAAPRAVVASCWRTVAARWILPVAAAILLMAPSLVVVSHALRTRANVDSVDALPPPVLSATSAAHGATPPPARERLSAAMPRGEATVQESAVRRALRSYQDAYDRLDVAAAADVWPTVDRRALSRAFDTLKSQGLDFQSCTITVSGDRATAQCRGTLRFVPKTGGPLPRIAEQQWVFAMRRVGGNWTIDKAVTSQVPVAAAEQARDQG
jgi:hypothetical protein